MSLWFFSGISSTGATVAIALTAMAFLMLSLFATFAAYVRWSKLKQGTTLNQQSTTQIKSNCISETFSFTSILMHSSCINAESKNLGQISNAFNKSCLSFKYENLEKATNYFDAARKIGQGGAGSVFKGTLPNGKTVAVKRLFFNNRQWVDEFFNEVNLISGIQHKNLVKLLGCSIEGPESLLVYEYVPNKSLNQFLFGNSLSFFKRIFNTRPVYLFLEHTLSVSSQIDR